MIPEWRSLGQEFVPPREASRHFLVFGESGAGKSTSVVIPFVKAALRYPSNPVEPICDADDRLRASVLLIDPKYEIGPVVEQVNWREGLGRSIVHLECGGDDWTVWLFEDADLSTITGQEVVERILSVSAEYAFQRSHTREAFFILQAEGMLEVILDADLAIHRTRGKQAVSEFWARLATSLQGVTRGMLPICNSFGRALALASLGARTSPARVMGAHASLCDEFGVEEEIRSGILSLGDMAMDTYSSVVATLLGMVKDVSSNRFQGHVSVDPLQRPSINRHFSIRDALARGAVIVHSARNRSSVDTAVGRALKALYFKEVLAARSGRPTFYICDEAQRYVSTDPVSGEQSFMDRARAYRASCMLATQSISSLQYAISTDRAGGNDAALDILLANTGSKFFFRSTDPRTRDLLRRILPAPAGIPGSESSDPHVLTAS